MQLCSPIVAGGEPMERGEKRGGGVSCHPAGTQEFLPLSVPLTSHFLIFVLSILFSSLFTIVQQERTSERARERERSEHEIQI